MLYFDEPNDHLYAAVASLLSSFISRERPPLKFEIDRFDTFFQVLIESPGRRKELLSNALKTRTGSVASAAVLSQLRTALDDTQKEKFVTDVGQFVLAVQGLTDLNRQNLSSMSLLLGVSFDATRRIIDSINAVPPPRRI